MGQRMESLMTVKEVASLLRLSPQTLYKMRERGTIPAVRVGHQWRFERQQILKWLAKQRSEGAGNGHDGQ